MLVKLSVGVAYKFIVDPPFQEATGVYIVNGILSYSELVMNGIDLYTTTYSKYSVSKDIFDTDLPSLRNSSILKLSNPDNPDTDITYIPSIYITQVPDHNVKKYRELVMAIHLGILDDSEILDSIGTNITEYLTSALGVETIPQLFELKQVWMSESEYAQLELERKNRASGVINYFTECVRLRNEVDRLRNTLVAYEEIFQQLNIT